MNISHRIGIVAAASAALLFAGTASAQSRAGDVFLQIFNVGSAGQSIGEDINEGAFLGINGSTGCSDPGKGGGPSDGDDLSLFVALLATVGLVAVRRRNAN